MQQYQQQPYKEPAYLVRPSWSLAWGLFWRWFVIILPFYGTIFLLASLLRK